MTAKSSLSDIDTIAFDADDTLWHTENLFRDVQVKLGQILARYAPRDDVQARLHETEMRNIGMFGYGVKGFTLSMVETAIDISEAQISATDIHKIVLMGKALLDAPMTLFDDAEAVLAQLGKRYRLFLITKGDVLDQRNKIGNSGLEPLFERTVVVQEKDEATYASVFADHGLTAERVAMVGNSLKSDVLPLLGLGGVGIYIPYHLTAHFEQVTTPPDHPRYHRIEALNALPTFFGLI